MPGCVVEVWLSDPIKLGVEGYPDIVEVFYVTLNRDLNDIANDHGKPGSELLDEAILKITFHRPAKCGVYHKYNCAYCGGGLSIKSCNGCGHTFEDDHQHGGTITPLSPKMVAFLRENGREFGIDPEVAQHKERKNWELSQLS